MVTNTWGLLWGFSNNDNNLGYNVYYVGDEMKLMANTWYHCEFDFCLDEAKTPEEFSEWLFRKQDKDGGFLKGTIDSLKIVLPETRVA